MMGQVANKTLVVGALQRLGIDGTSKCACTDAEAAFILECERGHAAGIAMATGDGWVLIEYPGPGGFAWIREPHLGQSLR